MSNGIATFQARAALSAPGSPFAIAAQSALAEFASRAASGAIAAIAGANPVPESVEIANYPIATSEDQEGNITFTNLTITTTQAVLLAPILTEISNDKATGGGYIRAQIIEAAPHHEIARAKISLGSPGQSPSFDSVSEYDLRKIIAETAIRFAYFRNAQSLAEDIA